MEICELTEYGIFDTKTAFPGRRRTVARSVTEYEIEFYTAVTGHAVLDGRIYDITPGTLICSKPGETRGSVFDFRCFYIHARFPKASPYREILDSVPNFYRIIDREVYGRIFEDLIRHLFSEGYSKESDYVNAKLLELFYYLGKDAQRNRNYLEHTARRIQTDSAIPRAVEFIREHYREDISLSDIAYVTGYSPNYFHHVFTAVMGKTPQRYLLDVRLGHAKYLLAQPEKTLSEIAYECGFSSQAYFTEQFKKMTYTTPGQYRKRCMERYYS
ncbi:MAG: helix-turn-helix transcriptional regulator [Ruminococcaceae bacterium]|nr:helix-turn-helix transcriptional regulator [Oscillospiraceae bacterium]